MEHFFDWARGHVDPAVPWLILGKGPTFALRTRFDLRGYRLLALNHAVREQAVDLAHLIDLDIVRDCGDALEGGAERVVIPWYPHVDNQPGRRPLSEIIPHSAVLQRLHQGGRLLWYDLSTGPRRHGNGPVVQATYFSAEAAVSLLSLAGVRRVRSLGVDGGATYSADFDDLARRTLLANGQPAFDLQFRGIAKTIHQTGIDFAPLDLPSPMLACIVGEEGSVLPDRVLEYSVRRRASMTVRFERVGSAKPVDLASATALDQPWRRVILCRHGSLVLDDLRKLWARPFEGEAVESPRRPAGDPSSLPALVMVSASAPSRLEELAAAAPNGVAASETLPVSWGGSGLSASASSIVHYDDPTLQPWVSRAHPLAHLWVGELLDAVRHQCIPLELIRAEARLGHIRPSLLEQIERDNPEPLLTSRAARQLDAQFVVPGGTTPACREASAAPRDVLRAVARHVRRQAGAYRRARRGR